MGPFEKALATFAALRDDDLGGEHVFGGHTVTARFLLYEMLRDEETARIRAEQAWRATETERILLVAQEAFGDLRGLLLGRDDALLDRATAEGEWPLRQVLRHVLCAELRYAAQVLYSAHRREDQPLAIPRDRLPCDRITPPEPQDAATRSGGIERILGTIASARAQTDALAGGLPAETLERPSLWGELEVDVRRRLHQIAAHVVEHTLQCEKTLEAFGLAHGEARGVVRRIVAARAGHESISDDATLHGLDAIHAQRATALAEGEALKAGTARG